MVTDVPQRMQYHRFICLVPLVGTGKPDDPVRPEYTPATNPSGEASRDGVLAWSSQMTDDGKMAIVHLVASNPLVFDRLRADKRHDIRVFEVGKTLLSKLDPSHWGGVVRAEFGK